jgi:hypothetical protein
MFNYKPKPNDDPYMIHITTIYKQRAQQNINCSNLGLGFCSLSRWFHSASYSGSSDSATMDRYEFITFEEGWQILQNGITKLQNIVEGLPEPNFTCAEHMHLYTYVSISENNNNVMFFHFRSLKFCITYINFLLILSSLYMILFFHQNCNAGLCTICACTRFLVTMIRDYITCTRKHAKSISDQKWVTTIISLHMFMNHAVNYGLIKLVNLFIRAWA